MQLHNSITLARRDDLLARLNTGGGSIRVNLYRSAAPNNTPGSAPAPTDLLVSIPFGTAELNNLDLIVLPAAGSVTIAQSGTAVWALLLAKNGNGIGRLTVGDAMSSADVRLSTLTLAAGNSLDPASLTLTEPGQ